MEYENFILERHKNISIITINRPPANAWNLSAMEEFENIIDEIEAYADTKSVRINYKTIKEL